MMSAIPLASARFSKLRFPFLNNLLDGDLCKDGKPLETNCIVLAAVKQLALQ